MWQLVGQITSAITLIAFAIAAITAIVRRRLLSRERQLLAVGEEDRPALVQALNDSFLVPSLPVDPKKLTADQGFRLLLEQIRDRSRRFYVTSILVAFLACLCAGVAVFALSQPDPPDTKGGSPAQPTPTPTSTTEPVVANPFPFEPASILQYRYSWQGRTCTGYFLDDGHGRWAEFTPGRNGCLRTVYYFQEISRDGNGAFIHDSNRGYYMQIPLDGGWATLGDTETGPFARLHQVEAVQ